MEKKLRIAVIAGAIVLAIGVLALLYVPGKGLYDRQSATTTAATSTQEQSNIKWQTYTNGTYKFSIDYPSDWKVVEDDFVGSPRITLYDPKKTGGAQPPFDHHSFATHVSIFPKGLPTEGVSGETQDTQVKSRESINRGLDFLLKDKKPWATMLTFKDTPASWQGGFVWAAVTIGDLDISCLRGEQFVPYEQCDVLTGDLYVREGIIDAILREKEVKMLESFQFLP